MLRVMIMDDSADSQRPSLYLRLMLEEVGYVVVAEVFESRKIYEAVKSRKPDVIIIDTESPSRDTLECRRRLNFDQGGGAGSPRTPVILPASVWIRTPQPTPQ